MRSLTFAIATIGAALAFGCATQQPAEKPMAAKAEKAQPAPAKAKPKPALIGGASATMLANTCAGCHGTGGASTGPATPSIAGLEEEYFVDVMNEYKSGERASTIMGRIAKGYDDGEIAAIAEYYGAMPFASIRQTSVGPKARRGAKLHEEYCEKCHENEGREPEDIVLAGQWMPYVLWTMEDYASGKSKIVEKKMATALEKMLSAHGEQSLTDLSHFYGSRR
jgi:sulfide dehydrogenase cytochrome subunit